MLELGIPEQGAEDGDVPQPRELVDAVGAGGVDQARQHDGLAGVDVDHRIRLAGQEGRIALNGERRIDLADGGVDRRQDVALVIHVRLDLELHAVILVGDRNRAEARAHRNRHLTAGEEGGGAAAAGDQTRIGQNVGLTVLHGEIDLRGDGGDDAAGWSGKRSFSRF